jgi:hypothetical protein
MPLNGAQLSKKPSRLAHGAIVIISNSTATNDNQNPAFSTASGCTTAIAQRQQANTFKGDTRLSASFANITISRAISARCVDSDSPASKRYPNAVAAALNGGSRRSG